MPCRLWIHCLRTDSEVIFRLLHTDIRKYHGNIPSCGSFLICSDWYSLGSFKSEDARLQGSCSLCGTSLSPDAIQDPPLAPITVSLLLSFFPSLFLLFFWEIFLTLSFITSKVRCCLPYCLFLQVLLCHFSFHHFSLLMQILGKFRYARGSNIYGSGQSDTMNHLLWRNIRTNMLGWLWGHMTEILALSRQAGRSEVQV